MANKHVTTQKGLALLAKQQAGGALPNITRVVAGAGYIDPALLDQQTEVLDPIAEMEVGDRRLVDGKIVRLPVQLSNMHLTDTAMIRQIGVYSQDPDEGEILYQIVQYEYPVPLPTYAANNGGVILFEPELDLMFSNGELAEIPSTPEFLVTQQYLHNYTLDITHLLDRKIDKTYPTEQYEVYVSKSGNDETGDGSMGAPYLTIQRAINRASLNVSAYRTTIWIGDGAYEESLWMSSGANLLLTSLSESTNAVKISGPQNQRVIINWGSSSAQFQYLTVEGNGNSLDHIIFSAEATLYVGNCVIKNNGSGSPTGIYITGNSMGRVISNQINNCGTAIQSITGSVVLATANTGSGNSIALSAASAIAIRSGTLPGATTATAKSSGGQIFE